MRDLRRLLVRRWYLFMAVLIAATVGLLVTVQSVGPTYRAEATVLLLPPETAWQPREGEDVPANPYLYLSGVVQARDVLLKALGSVESQETLVGAHRSAAFAATADPTSSGPMVILEVDAPSPGEAVAALDTFVESVPPTIRALQSDYVGSQAAAISTQVITQDTTAVRMSSSQVRAGIFVTALILAAGVLSIALADRLIGRATKSPPAGMHGDLVRASVGEPRASRPILGEGLDRDARAAARAAGHR